jgi:predicted transcriptional regulator
MTDLLEVRDDGEFVISGTVSRDELEAELTPLNPRSLFDRRLKTVLRNMLDEADGDEIIVEALVRNGNTEP